MGRLHKQIKNDDGMTMIEMIVGMGIMVVALTIFTMVIVRMNAVASHNTNVANTSNQVNNAFVKLDKTVRYASSISQPNTTKTNNSYYVEFQTANTGSVICRQLQLNTSTKTLKLRSWTPTSSGGTTGLSAFSIIANGVTAPATGVPFTLLATGRVPFEQLTVRLASIEGNPSVTSESNVTFTAVNSLAASTAAKSSATAPSSVCQEAGRP